MPGATWVHDGLAQRVRFGSGQANQALRAETATLGASRVMAIAGPSQSSEAAAIMAGVPVSVWHYEAAVHVPIEAARRARDVAAGHEVDAIVAIGGGSVIGLAKAIALTSGLPIVAVPTTYAGSEATPVWGLTDGACKTTGVDERVLPRAVVYDATLTTSLPVAISVASGFNAVAHCVDSMWAPETDPIDEALAGEGLRALATGLLRVVADPTGLPGREQTLYAAYLSAVAFASAGAGLHHKICHVLGGGDGLPHAQTHAVVLPYVLAFNAPAAPEAEQRIATALGSTTALAGLQALKSALGAPRALAPYGFTEADINTAAEAIVPTVPPTNPRPVDLHDLRHLLRSALHGRDPADLSHDEQSQLADVVVSADRSNSI